MFNNILADLKRIKPGFDHNLSIIGLFRQIPLRSILSYFLSLEFQAVVTYRFARFCYLYHIPIIGFVVSRITEIMTGAAIPARAEIGRGLKIVHFGPIVIHSNCKIGEHCDIDHGVTIGERDASGKVPVIGNNVLIGSYACIIGDVSVGDNSKIGAHTVLLNSMPKNSVAVGNPGKVVKTNIETKLL